MEFVLAGYSLLIKCFSFLRLENTLGSVTQRQGNIHWINEFVIKVGFSVGKLKTIETAFVHQEK